mmetsp:Transcript_30311/g.94851  ORF Transcript_30311/g.94851 Transcript_30311/m.94851 type:complete len:208 (-) Transcript_30311:570-1193(-)
MQRPHQSRPQRPTRAHWLRWQFAEGPRCGVLFEPTARTDGRCPCQRADRPPAHAAQQPERVAHASGVPGEGPPRQQGRAPAQPGRYPEEAPCQLTQAAKVGGQQHGQFAGQRRSIGLSHGRVFQPGGPPPRHAAVGEVGAGQPRGGAGPLCLRPPRGPRKRGDADWRPRLGRSQPRTGAARALDVVVRPRRGLARAPRGITQPLPEP